MATGIVKWFSPTKGYGFIEPDDDSEDIFVHNSALDSIHHDAVLDGARVTFEIVPSPTRSGRVCAANVEMAK